MGDIRMPERKSGRMHGEDYRAPGSYFVTSCVEMRLPLFGVVENTIMKLNKLGQLVKSSLEGLGNYYAGVSVPECVVMPNHIHAIISLNRRPELEAAFSLSDVIQRFKSYTGKVYLKGIQNGEWPAMSKVLWQRGFHDIVIRDARSENRLRKYVVNNPRSWENDKHNPNWKLAAISKQYG